MGRVLKPQGAALGVTVQGCSDDLIVAVLTHAVESDDQLIGAQFPNPGLMGDIVDLCFNAAVLVGQANPLLLLLMVMG